MDFEVVLGSKLEPKSIKNLFESVSKIRCDFEWVLDGSWTDFGSILEAKLGPSWAYVSAWTPQEEHHKNISKNTYNSSPGFQKSTESTYRASVS